MFGDPKKMAALIVGGPKGEAAPDVEPDGDETGGDDGLQMAAQDLMSAIDAKDPAAVAEALRAAFALVDAEPHEEGEHE